MPHHLISKTETAIFFFTLTTKAQETGDVKHSMSARTWTPTELGRPLFTVKKNSVHLKPYAYKILFQLFPALYSYVRFRKTLIQNFSLSLSVLSAYFCNSYSSYS